MTPIPRMPRDPLATESRGPRDPLALVARVFGKETKETKETRKTHLIFRTKTNRYAREDLIT